MNIISEITKPLVTKTVVIYAGRFQPFHKGHYDAYKRLVSKFGQDSVYIGTSNDTNDSKSPFNFNEKKKIATTMFGIPSNHFVQIRNPYKPVEFFIPLYYFSKFISDNSIIIKLIFKTWAEIFSNVSNHKEKASACPK